MSQDITSTDLTRQADPARLIRSDDGTILNWNPEDTAQWAQQGRRVANRNLVGSIFAEFLGFSIWALWSIVVPQLGRAGFQLTVDQMFWLVSIPSLVGATLRLPYTFAVPVFGGRNWTIISALLLLIPASALAIVVQRPETPFWVLMVVAALAGVGGGNFSSSMANISFFFPEQEKGRALGLNAAGGNLGTAAVQFAVPLVIVSSAGVALERAGLIFIPLALLAALLAWRTMDNLGGISTDKMAFARAAQHRHTWLLSVIYIGTFGSFIGYSGAFPTLLKNQFPTMSLSMAFLGALVGSVTRPLGGMVADRFGGARVTCASFICMGIGAVCAILGLGAHSFPVFFGAFLWLFAWSGIGNGSVYRMIPTIFSVTAGQEPMARLQGKKAAAGCIGIAGAIGAFGGFLIPRGFALSTNAFGSLIPALWVFVAGYAALLLLTWAIYLRPGSHLAAHGI